MHLEGLIDVGCETDAVHHPLDSTRSAVMGGGAGRLLM